MAALPGMLVERMEEEREATPEEPEPPVDVPIVLPAGPLSAEQVAAYARGAGFPESVIPQMVAIAFRESRFDPGAVNSSSTIGSKPGGRSDRPRGGSA